MLCLVIEEILSGHWWPCVLPCDWTHAIDLLKCKSTNVLCLYCEAEKGFGHWFKSHPSWEGFFRAVYIVKQLHVPLCIINCIKPQVFRTLDLRLCQTFWKSSWVTMTMTWIGAPIIHVKNTCGKHEKCNVDYTWKNKTQTSLDIHL